MSVDELALFRAHLRDRGDPENLPLPGPDDPRAYEDPVEIPGAFIDKLSKRVAKKHLEDDLNKSVGEPEFKNPLHFAKGTVGYRLRISRQEIVEQDGVRWCNAYDDRGKCVASRRVEE